jgi:hypothetical protein
MDASDVLMPPTSGIIIDGITIEITGNPRA